MATKLVNFTDSVKLAGVKVTQEGYLIADAFAVRTGIQTYLGSEVGRPDLQTVAVYRSEGEVFSRDSVQSFSHVPVTLDHPQEAVTKDNWKDLARGEASSEVMRDGERLRIPLIVKDAQAIQAITGGKRELSAGYACDLDWTGGTTPQGLKYDAAQVNIRANHIAIVDRGRAGAEFRIGDNAINWGPAPITKDEGPKMKTMLVDGIPVEVTDATQTVIAKLIADRDGALSAKASVVEASTAAIAAKDAEIGTLKVEVKKLTDAVPSGASLDKLVADRAALVTVASQIVKDFKPTGLTDADIRKAVVTAKLGDELTKDASEAEISGMFKAIAKDAGSAQDDGLRTAMLGDNRPLTGDVTADAYVQMVKDMQGGKIAA